MIGFVGERLHSHYGSIALNVSIILIALALCIGGVQAQAVRLMDQRNQLPANPAEQIGTGFVVGAEKIVTTAHGIQGCTTLSIIPNDSGPISVSQVAVDQAADLALISVKLPQSQSSLPVQGVTDPAIGDQIYMLGFPLQFAFHLRLPSFYVGMVTGLRGVGGDPQVYRLGFVALPGMSGAAVLNNKGQVIGVVKSHIIERAPNGGPTLGGQTFVVSGRALANFLRANGASTAQSAHDELLTTQEIAAHALTSSVTVVCTK